MQAFDLLGLERHGRIAPAEADIRVMALRFGQVSHTLHEGERLGKVFEPEGALDPVTFISDGPSGCLPVMCLDLLWGERGDPAPAGRASFGAQRFGLCGHRAASSLPGKGSPNADRSHPLAEARPGTEPRCQ